jgi:hypothetical protein
VTDRELEDAALDLASRWRSARAAALVATLCAVLAVLAAPLALPVGISLTAGAAAGALVAFVHVRARRKAVARLALEPTAYVLSEVSQYGSRFTAPDTRRRLAAWLREIVRDVNMCQFSWCLTDRVARHARQLESLADDLLAFQQAPIRPASAVACHRLLTCAAESPLYNPAIPDEELDATIARIRRGIARAEL